MPQAQPQARSQVPRCKCCGEIATPKDLLAYDGLCPACWGGEHEGCKSALADDTIFGEDEELCMEDAVMDEVDALAQNLTLQVAYQGPNPVTTKLVNKNKKTGEVRIVCEKALIAGTSEERVRAVVIAVFGKTNEARFHVKTVTATDLEMICRSMGVTHRYEGGKTVVPIGSDA
jgi:hypothetical protein